MLFTEFGNKENPPVLLLHGMMQDWQSEYELMILPHLLTKHDKSKNMCKRITTVKFMVLMVHRKVV